MTRRPSIARRPSAALIAALTAACRGSGPPPAEPLWRPTPTAPAAGATAPCRTNFFDPPHAGPRQEASARRLGERAEGVGVTAGARPETGPAIVAIRLAIDALRKDPYGPAPTYALAVGYAVVDRPACAVALLERLAALAQYPPTQAEAARAVERATRDPIFAPFRADADRALGR